MGEVEVLTMARYSRCAMKLWMPLALTDGSTGASSWASSFPHIFGEDEKRTVAIPALM